MKKPAWILPLILLSCHLSLGADNDNNNNQDAPVTNINAHVVDAGTQETTQFGVKINNTDSLQMGDRGPTLLEDFMLREKIMHFDHERIPERAVHARGVAVHGYFQSYRDWSNLTAARLLRDTSIKTPVFVRFSTVLGSRGSADCVRDVRGFSTRFYTQEGNWDLVANAIAPFFIQDAIKFPDLIHAGKPEQNTEVPQAATAHNTAYDFFGQHTETIHTVMWALSGRGTPRSFRQVEGFGVHTFRFINEHGKTVLVKFHWKPLQGLSNLEWDEAQKINGKDTDFHRNDLYTAIQRGDYPEYELGVQIVNEEDQDKFDFDLLDATKIIPESLVPVTILGKMTLNRIPDNYFSETEQVTYHPGHVVRGKYNICKEKDLPNSISGVTFTDDPLLQGRLFSYLDTQINRMGSANYLQLPINRPLVPVHNNQRDGFMQFNVYHGPVAYYPNALQNNTPEVVSPREGGYMEYPEKISGRKQRGKYGKFSDHFSQAQLFYNSLTTHEQQQVVNNFRFELGKCTSMLVRENFIKVLNRVDNNLARRVARGIGVHEPEPVSENHNQTTINLSIDNYKRPNNIKAKKVAILTGPGISTSEVEQMRDYLTKEHAYVDVVGIKLGESDDGLNITETYLTTSSVLYDAIYIPSGSNSTFDFLTKPHPEFPYDEPSVFVLDAFRHGKPIAVSGNGIELLKKAHVRHFGSSEQAAQYGVYISTDMPRLESQFKKGIIIQRFWNRMPLDPDAKESPTRFNVTIPK
ncbi:Putative Heme-dependent catalase [Rhizopus microsporus]|nr:Putative Heme-dependent catalase [Rhizopus microsporus]